MHNDFTFFSRKVPSGKKVVYYYAYDEGGRRLGPCSTGESNKTGARNYCNRLIRGGGCCAAKKRFPCLPIFPQAFGIGIHRLILRSGRSDGNLTMTYVDANKRRTAAALIPYFGKMRLDTITADVIENWFDLMIKKGYQNNTTNSYYGVLKTMIC